MSAEPPDCDRESAIPRFLVERSFRLLEITRPPTRFFEYCGTLSRTRELDVARVPLQRSKDEHGHEFDAHVQHGWLLRVHRFLRRSLVIAVVAEGSQLILEVMDGRYDLLKDEATLGVARFGPFRRLRIEFADGRRPLHFLVLMPLLQALFHDPATDFEFTDPANFVFLSLRQKATQVAWRQSWSEGVDPVFAHAYPADR